MNTVDSFAILFDQSTTTLSSVPELATRYFPWSIPLGDPLLIASQYFVSFGTYIAYATGIPGNLLTLVILIKMRPFNSSSIWLIALTFTALGVTICLTVCLGMSMYIHEVYRANVYGACVLREKYSMLWGLVYESYIQTTILVLLPLVLLGVLNGLIVRRLIMANKVQQKMSETQSKEKSKHQRQINRMLIANSICLFICVMPDILYQYYKMYIVLDENGSRSRSLMANTFSVLKVYNSAANFFLYITAAHKFRNELIRLLTCNRYGNSGRGGNTTKYLSETKASSDGYSQSVK